MSGAKIIAGLNDALAFLGGDRLSGRIMGRRPNGLWADVSAQWLAERGVISKPARVRVVEGPAASTSPRGGAETGARDE